MQCDNEQLTAIIEAHYDSIWAFCRRRLPRDGDADDLTQSVFLALIESVSRIEADRVRPWLYQTAANRIAEFYRALYREREIILSDGLNEDTLGVWYDPFGTLDEDELAAEEAALAARLSALERSLCEDIARYAAGEVSYAELARKYAVSEPTVRKRVSRLKEKVRRWIAELHSLML